MFRDVDKTPSFSQLEQSVIDFWKTHSIFQKSIAKDAPKGDFVFYEGPPTANGKPGVHHVISRAYKDIFLRYKTMQGYRVARKGGWDTHGLPVELAIEKRLGFTQKLRHRSLRHRQIQRPLQRIRIRAHPRLERHDRTDRLLARSGKRLHHL